MPIYEFYCPDCHTVFSFFSRRVNTEKRPDCPKCGRSELSRRPSVFALSRGQKEGMDGDMPDIDEAKLERAFESMAGELGSLNEEDPRAMGRMMRRLYDAAGLGLGPGMEEALSRMEAGEDPESIEEEMGNVLESEEPITSGGGGGLKGLRNRLLPPKVDETLYDL
jgi:putative FmdB family regulatory protein